MEEGDSVFLLPSLAALVIMVHFHMFLIFLSKSWCVCKVSIFSLACIRRENPYLPPLAYRVLACALTCYANKIRRNRRNQPNDLWKAYHRLPVGFL